MVLPTEESFEYRNLDQQTRRIVWQYTTEIKDLMRLTAENIISIGKKLTQVKSQLGHGSFQQWLKTEFEWSEQTARQFMQVYRWSQTIENKKFVFSKLGTSALYLLAAPSTPPEARVEVLSLVDGGEKVSYTRAKNIINRYRELPMATTDNVTETIATEVKSKTSGELEEADNLWFRLETSELGCIVKLYRAHELTAMTNLKAGAIVKIKSGRWQGRKAKIIEILNEQQLTTTDLQQSNPKVAVSSSSEMKIEISNINQADLDNREKLREIGQHLIISYGNVCLAIKGNPQTLTAFIEQVKIDFEFVRDIFRQALEKQN